MDQRFDVVVVGGGPSGAAAAHVMAAKGMKVAIVDKAIFPRDKLCGGLLSERSKAIFKSVFGDVWGPTIENTANGVAFYHRDRFLNQLDSYRPVYFTSRSQFDAYLMELATKKGAQLFQGTAVSSIDFNAHTISLADGRHFHSDFIIGADGVNSRISKQIDSTFQNRNSLAIGLEIDLPLDLVKRRPVSPEIYFGYSRWGYGWAFPKAKSITVGLAGLCIKNKDLRENFLCFLRQICGSVPNIPIRGHYIPFGKYMEMPGRSDVLLVGDAAGLVEPVTGEGIAFAMLSGKYAAEAILQAASLGTPAAAINIYLKGYEKILQLLRQAKWMRYFFFHAISEKLFLRVLPHSKSMITGYMDLLAGEIDYKDYCLFIAKRITRYPFILLKLAK